MKKLILLICAVLVVFPLVMTGCGVAKEDYEAVVAERDALQAAKNALQADYNTLQADNDALQADYDAVVADKSEAASLFAQLNYKLEAVDMLLHYFSSLEKTFTGQITWAAFEVIDQDFEDNFGDYVDNINNDELSDLWDNCEDAEAADDGIAWENNLAAIMDLLQDLIDDDVAAIEAALD